MDDKPSKSDVEAQLRQAADAMSDRLASIQDEVSTTGDAVRTWIREHPLESVGIMLGAGLLVGLAFGGTRRKRRRRHQKLIDQYLDALTDEVEAARTQGDEPKQALDKALRDRVPLVVYTANGESDGPGFLWNLFGESIEIVIRTALSLVARDLIETVIGNANMEEMMDEDLF